MPVYYTITVRCVHCRCPCPWAVVAEEELPPDTKVTIYAGFIALLVNLVVAVLATLVLRAMKVAEGVDATADTDYTAEREDPTFRELPEPLESVAPGHEGEFQMRR